MMMSIKAYDFYIMNKKKLNDYLLFAKKIMGEFIIEHFRKHPDLNKIIAQRGIASWDSFKELLPEITRVMQSQSYTNKPYLDLTCGISIWIWNDYAVVKIFGFDYGFANSMAKLKQPRYVSDFHFQNSSDKPDEIDGREWGRRRRFFSKTIDNLPRMEYIPYPFLSREHFKTIFDISHLNHKMKGKGE